MVDRITQAQRSALMSRIRHKDTTPEMVVRRLVHGLGYRYVLHDKRLPGKPDLVFPSRRCVIEVHGCFWHGHGCAIAPTPKSNTAYWGPKIAGNVARDQRNAAAIRSLGWRLLVVWECQTKAAKVDILSRKLVRFLG